MFKGYPRREMGGGCGKMDARQDRLRADAAERVVALKPIKDRGLVFHGLRKSAVVMLLEAGCTEAMVSAITGQTSQMVALYARDVNNARLARAGMAAWEKSWQQEPKGNGFASTADMGPPDLGAAWTMALPQVLAQVETGDNLRLMAALERRDGFKRRGRQGRFVVRKRVRELVAEPLLRLPSPTGRWDFVVALCSGQLGPLFFCRMGWRFGSSLRVARRGRGGNGRLSSSKAACRRLWGLVNGRLSSSKAECRGG